MFKRIICTLLLVLVSFCFSVNVSATNRYQWIASTKYVTVSYDTRSVKYYSEHGKVVDVWVAWKFTDEGARKWIENGRANGIYQGAKWDNFSYYLEHNLVLENSAKRLEIVYYDVNGTVIESTNFRQRATWSSIVPGSVFEAVRDKFIGFFNS